MPIVRWKARFNVVLLDLRSHGMSEGKYFIYGFHEWQDITAAIDVANAKQADQTFAILGVSAGGTVAISAAARDQRIWKVVTIGTFADLGETIEAQTKWLPGGLRKRAIGRSIDAGRSRALGLVLGGWTVGRLDNGTGLAGVRRSTISGMENDEVFFFFPWIWGSGQDDFEIRV